MTRTEFYVRLADAMVHAPQPRVGDPLPAKLLAEDMQRLLGVGQTRFYQLLKDGRLDRFEIRPTIGPRAWSGRLVALWLNAEPGASRFVAPKSRAS